MGTDHASLPLFFSPLVSQYSNLSYAIAGRIVARVSGHPLHEFVRSELLEPLGMQDSHFSVHRVDAAHLAIGHSRPDSQGGDAAAQEPWQAEPFTEPGEFSAIGGLFSSVRSLAVWVCGFVRAFGESGATDADDAVAHPLSAASRREMQQTHRSCLPRARTDLFLYGDESLSYGFGLAIEADARFGVCVSHSGGYPGYGSHMRWDPTTGLGVIALANGRYADAQRVGKIAHRMLLEHARPTYAQIVLQRPLDCVWPSTWAAHASVRALLREWDDSVCDVLFAVNVDLDETREHRRQSVVTAVAQVGGLIENDGAELDAVSNVRCDSASEMVWHERGRNGHVKVEIQMSPQSEPLLQTMRMTAVPAAIAAVSAAGAAGDASTAWAAAPAPAAFRIFIALAAADRELVESTWPAGLVSHAAVISRSFASFAAARAIDGPLHWADESLHEPNVWRVCGRAFVWGLRVLEAPLERAAEDSRSPAAAAHAQSLVSVCELVLVDKR